ncbi:hypothetical protein [Nonomuraea sp. LPB2021202275-12-8]|uniref:hypothetical protein n=1 Tax=Nonomuraea sp. LPB2021202275-12-8 TaxID=3120159 RepID=UPI00300C08D2
MAAEFELDDYILVQDGRVLEIFHRDVSESTRFHVAFVGIDVQPRGEEYKVRIGRRHGEDMIVDGIRLTMDQERFARFREFIAGAIAARDLTG